MLRAQLDELGRATAGRGRRGRAAAARRHRHPRRVLVGAGGRPQLISVPPRQAAPVRQRVGSAAAARRVPRRGARVRRRVLRDQPAGGPRARPAAPAAAGGGLGGAGARRRRRRPRLATAAGPGSTSASHTRTTGMGAGRRRRVLGHRQRALLRGRPGRLRARADRAGRRGRHRLLVVAGRGPPGGAGAAPRRVRPGARRRGQPDPVAEVDRLLCTEMRCAVPGRAVQGLRRRAPTGSPAARAAAWWCSSALDAASRDGDRCSPCIHGSAVNQDGRSTRLHRAQRAGPGGADRGGAGRRRAVRGRHRLWWRRTARVPRWATRSRWRRWRRAGPRQGDRTARCSSAR